MSITKRHWLAAGWAATVLAAGWAGLHLGHDLPHVSVSPAVAHVSAVHEPATVTTSGSPGSGEIRAIVRDELSRQLADLRRAEPAAVATERAPEPSPTSPAQQALGDDASAVIDHAIQAGHWTSDDRKRFANDMRGLPPLSVFDLQRTLNVAINRGEVTIDDRLPPFGVQLTVR